MKYVLMLCLITLMSVPAFAADTNEALEKQLKALEAELPGILEEETTLDARQDYVNRVLALREKISGQKEEAKVEEKPSDKRMLIFKGFYTYDSEKGYVASPYSGISTTSCSYNECGKNVDRRIHISVDSYPERIIPGEPFSITASTHEQIVKHAGFSLGDWYSSFKNNVLRATTSISGYDGPSVKVAGRFNGTGSDYSYSSREAFEGEARSSVTLDFEYVEHDKETSSVGAYVYKVSGIKKNGELRGKDPTGDKQDLNYNERKEAKGDPKHMYGYKFTLNGQLTAVYDWGDVNDAPAKVAALPEEAPLVANRDAKQDGKTDESGLQQAGTNGGEQTQAAREGASGSQTGAAASSASSSMDAKRPHIEYWLANAEPALNADPYYQLTYDKWGRVQGKVPNGTITVNSDPQDGGGSPVDYAWGKRDTLDSLNLCTLSEYVERKLANRETASCKREKPAPLDKDALPNFVGKSSAAAKAMLQEKGITVKWHSGSIAKDTAQQGLIEKQTPAAGAKMKGLKQVDLWAYRYAAKTVMTPNVVGMTYAQAVEVLKKEGLKASVGTSVEPKTSSQAGKVVEQHTKAGNKIAFGATVVLDVAKGGSTKVTMPNVIGLPYGEAEAKLRSVGLNPVYKVGSYAPRESLVKTVSGSSHRAGQSLAIGETVTITAYNHVAAKPKTPTYTPPPVTSRPKCPVGYTVAPSGDYCVAIQQRQQPSYNNPNNSYSRDDLFNDMQRITNELADENARRREQQRQQRPTLEELTTPRGGTIPNYRGASPSPSYGGTGSAPNTGITTNRSRQQMPSYNNNNAGSGITTNRSRQQMQNQNNYGNSGGLGCIWAGGHDMLGIPGVEVSVYCQCGGQRADDSKCSGPKPAGNYYNSR